MQNILEKMRVPTENITIEVVEVHRNAEIAHRVEGGKFHFIIEGPSIDGSKMHKMFVIDQEELFHGTVRH